jgi:hypothetical protein
MTADNESASERQVSPFDTAASSATRFGIELVAWVAGPWAAAEITGTSWAAIPALIVLVGLPSVFNTPGDKNFTGVPTAGAARLGIELLLLAVAVGSSWVVWPAWAAVLVSILGVAMVTSGLPRYRWLLKQGRSLGGSG